jgi:murein DD-endopeptidase MepM/ murein hydrolase activator NlpD
MLSGAKVFGTSQKTRARRALAEIEKDRRGWLRHGIAALAISGLGLGVAGAVAMTGSATEAGPAAPGVTVATSPSAAGNAGVANGSRGDGVSRSTGRDALNGASTSPENSAAGNGQPLDGTVDMAARRAAQKNAKVTDTSTVDSSASKAAQARAKALQNNSERIEKLSTQLSKQEQQRRIAQAAAAGNTGTGTTPGTTGTTGTAPGPDGTAGAAGTDVGALSSSATGDGHVSLPVAPGAFSIAARFGQVGAWARYHTGIDFAAPIGTPIHATANGVVTNAGIGSASSWAGNYVTIKFSDGRQMLFAHMSSVSVSVGQQVTGGQLIGHVGMTGRAFGPHTHVELYPAGITPGDVYSAVDPAPWFAAHGLSI